MDRRDFLRKLAALGMAVGAVDISGLAPPAWATRQERLKNGTVKKRVFSGTGPGSDFVKFVDPLPLMELMPDIGVANQYQVEMAQPMGRERNGNYVKNGSNGNRAFHNSHDSHSSQVS